MFAVVAAWPRSGTSLLMAMLTAGGLDPVRDDDLDEVTEAHPVGAFQHSGVLLGDAAAELPGIAGDRSVVKLFPRHVIDLARAGIHPSKVVRAVRPYAESQASWAAAFPDRSPLRSENIIAAEAGAAFALLAEAAVPVLDVHYADLIDDPDGQAARIAEFIGDLDADAMATIPDASHRHHGPGIDE